MKKSTEELIQVMIMSMWMKKMVPMMKQERNQSIITTITMTTWTVG